MPSSEFAGKMRERMKQKRMRVTDLAKETRLPQPRISTYLNGKRRPSFETVIILAQALDWPRQEALEAASRNTAIMESDAAHIPALAEIAHMAERLNPGQKQALSDFLREVARSWLRSFSEPENVGIITDYADVRNSPTSSSTQSLQTIASPLVSRYVQ